MGKRTMALVLAAAAMSWPGQAQGTQQYQGLPLPSQVEKDLASRASNVTEVTLGKNMLAFAAKFMNGKDSDEAATRQLIQNLDGVYVREYEFDKDGQFSMEEVDRLRSYFETGEWTPMIREREKHSGETTDVMLKTVNGETRGMFILEAEPRDLTIVLILGPIHPEDLGKLTHIGGLGSLAEVARDVKVKDKTKDKDQDKDKKGGTQ
jgi:hypothetical protein